MKMNNKDLYLFQYDNYDHYVKMQLEKTEKLKERKQKTTWLHKDLFNFVYNNIANFYKINDKTCIICHGVRFGFEVEFFRKKFPIKNVYATELCEGAFLFNKENFSVMDFDKNIKEWHNKFDIVYSNSIDHSRNPIKTIDMWRKSLKINGIMYLTISWGNKVNTKDCFCLIKNSGENRDNYIQKIKKIIAPINKIELIYCSELYNRAKKGICKNARTGDIILKRTV